MTVIHLAEVDSTNDWIAAAAARGEPDGLWVRADRQTAGRGRRGRAWTSEYGNLFISTLVRPRQDESQPQQLSFVAALALHDVAAQYVASDRLSLKWPNDLLLDGLKCAGILVEGRNDAIIVGIGINLAHHPDNLERPAISFPAAGIASPPVEEAAARLAIAFDRRRSEWRTEGFSATRQAWLLHAAKLGESIEARLGNETLIGIFEGIDQEGALLLRHDDGTQRPIYAGEVFGM